MISPSLRPAGSRGLVGSGIGLASRCGVASVPSLARGASVARGPERPRRWATLILCCGVLLSGVGLLAGCGGGGSSEGADRGEASLLTAVRAQPVMYGEPMMIEVEGERLDPSVRVRVSGACESEGAIARTIDERWEASCTPDALGPVLIEVIDTSGSVLGQETLEVKPPRVEMQIGPETGGAAFTFELDPGDRQSSRRPWVDLFLYRVRQGEYDGTVFHELRGGVLHQGGCYRLDDQGIPRASSLSEPPLRPTPSLLGANIKDTLAMSTDPCVAGGSASQPGIFALHFRDNSDVSGTSPDSNRYVVIGRLMAGDPVAWGRLADEAPRIPSQAGWPPLFPADPEAVTLRTIERTQ
jgi:hypothetical protein